MRHAALLAALLLACAAAPSAQTPAGALLDAFIEDVGYDTFEASWTPDGEPFVPGDVPDADRIRARWRALLTPGWMRRQLRANYLAATTRGEIEAMQAWLDTPGLRAALAHDLAAALGPGTGRAEWARRAYAAGALEPRRVRAIDRVARAAGDGAPTVRYTLDMTALLVEHMMRVEAGDLTPPPGEVEALLAAVMDEMRADLVDASREDSRLAVAGRFADYPIEALEAYADALETAPGALYLRLVVDTVLQVRLDALRLALSSVAG